MTSSTRGVCALQSSSSVKVRWPRPGFVINIDEVVDYPPRPCCVVQYYGDDMITRHVLLVCSCEGNQICTYL